MKELKILIDLDETVYSLLSRWLAAMRYKYKIDLDWSDLKEYSIPNNLKRKYPGIQDSKIEQCMNLINEPGFFAVGNPISGCQSVIHKWFNQGHKITFVSNGFYAENSMIDKLSWVKKWFPYARLILTDDKSDIHGDIAIDDHIDYLNQYSVNHRILVSKPYNKDVDYDSGIRVSEDDWTKIDLLVKDLQNKI